MIGEVSWDSERRLKGKQGVWISGASEIWTGLLYYKIMLGRRSGGQCGHTPGGHPHLDPAGRGGHGGPDPLRCTLWVRAAPSVAHPGSGAFFTPGSEIWDGLKIKIRVRDQHPGSYFRELRNNILGLKFLNSLMRIWIRDPESF
jgi:hypothetical protein